MRAPSEIFSDSQGPTILQNNFFGIYILSRAITFYSHTGGWICRNVFKSDVYVLRLGSELLLMFTTTSFLDIKYKTCNILGDFYVDQFSAM